MKANFFAWHLLYRCDVYAFKLGKIGEIWKIRKTKIFLNFPIFLLQATGGVW